MSPYRTPVVRKPEPVPTILRRLFANLARLGAEGICDHFLSGYRWYRRATGGHWELWYINLPLTQPVLWLRIEHGERPGCGVLAIECEDYP